MKIKVHKDLEYKIFSNLQKIVINYSPELFLELKHNEDEVLEVFSPRTKKSITSEYILNRKDKNEPANIQMPTALRKRLKIELNEYVEVQKLKIDPNPTRLVIMVGIDNIPPIKSPNELLIELEGHILTKNEIDNPVIISVKDRNSGSRVNSKCMILEFFPPTTAFRIQYSTKISLLEFLFQDIFLEDEKYIEILKDLSGRATVMELEMVKNILKINDNQFIIKIFDWEKQLDYKINEKFIYFQEGSIRESLENLEKKFLDWETNEKKFEKRNEALNFKAKKDYENLGLIKLRILMEKGDHNANEAFKHDLIRRIKSDWKLGTLFLIKKGYFKYFDDSELKSLLFDANFNLRASLRDGLCDKSVKNYRLLAYLRKLCEIKDNSAWETLFFSHLNIKNYDNLSDRSVLYFHNLFYKHSFDIITFENYYNIYSRIVSISDVYGILNKISTPFLDKHGYRDYNEIFNYSNDLTSEERRKVKQIFLYTDDLINRNMQFADKKFYKVSDLNVYELLESAEKSMLLKNYGEVIENYDKIAQLLESFSDPYSDGIKRMIEINKRIIYKTTSKIRKLGILKKKLDINLLFYGPKMSGKATSIRYIFKELGFEKISVKIKAAKYEAFLFDYGTITFQSEVNQQFLKIHIYSANDDLVRLNNLDEVMGIDHFQSLMEIDGIIFIVDSQKTAYTANVKSWEKLGLIYRDKFKVIPIIIVFNKQDLGQKYNPIYFLEGIDYSRGKNIETIYSSAINGEGIMDSFERILGIIMREKYL
ncbi:MAG: hypothetical protein EU548_04935 [Promethearchaeota archaeon]|nr:MAG: hypothetical protein EU548_04935 [Candidatus Lokiarchaeota archaeon]